MPQSTAIIPLVVPWSNKQNSATHGSRLDNMTAYQDSAGVWHAVKRPGMTFQSTSAWNQTPGTYSGAGIGQYARADLVIWGDRVFMENGAGTWTDRGSLNGASPSTKKYVQSFSDGFTYITTRSAGTTVNLHRVSTGTNVDDIDNATYPASAGFPTKSSMLLAGGLVSLDDYLCVLTTNGRIYNSALGDGTSWSSLDFVGTQRAGSGVMLLQHHNHLVLLGSAGWEAYYNADLATGSPFLRREDLFESVGCADAASVATYEDEIFFVAKPPTGDRYVARMANFRTERISTPDIERHFLNDVANAATEVVYAATLKIQGDLLYILSVVDDSDESTRVTLVWSSNSKQWSKWYHASGNLEIRSVFHGNASFGDDTGNTYILTQDYVYKFSSETFRDELTSGVFSAITARIITPEWLGEPHENGIPKFINRVRIVSDHDSTNSVQLEVSNDDYNTWIDYGSKTQVMDQAWANLGRFMRAAFRVTHTANAAFRARLMHVVYEPGQV